MRRLRSAAMLSLCALVGAGCGNKYRVGYRLSNGGDTAPAGTDRGTATSIRYRDYGGALSNWMQYLISYPAPPQGSSTFSKRDVKTECTSTECVTTTTITSDYQPPSAGEVAAYKERAKQWDATIGQAILSGEFPLEAVVDYASPSLGGDTQGSMAGLNYRSGTNGFGPFLTSFVSVGIAGGKYTTKGRKQRRLVAVGNNLEVKTAPKNFDYIYFGFPLRFTGLIAPKISTYLQVDLNVIGPINEGNDSQIVRFGVTGVLPWVNASLEVSADRLRTDSFTTTAEVGIDF
jgi:hypothetical protein